MKDENAKLLRQNAIEHTVACMWRSKFLHLQRAVIGDINRAIVDTKGSNARSMTNEQLLDIINRQCDQKEPSVTEQPTMNMQSESESENDDTSFLRPLMFKLEASQGHCSELMDKVKEQNDTIKVLREALMNAKLGSELSKNEEKFEENWQKQSQLSLGVQIMDFGFGNHIVELNEVKYLLVGKTIKTLQAYKNDDLQIQNKCNSLSSMTKQSGKKSGKKLVCLLSDAIEWKKEIFQAKLTKEAKSLRIILQIV